MARLSPNALGCLYMALGSLGYVINDAFIRRITDDGPDVYQVLALRSFGLAVVFAVIGFARGEQTRRSHLSRPLLKRVGAEMIGSACFFAALVRMDFANAQAILQLVPFAVTLAAALVLKEKVTARQYVTILVGLVGVMIVIRPATEGFSMWSLVVVVSATFMVAREFATRDVDPSTPVVSIAFVTAVGLGALTFALSLANEWKALSASNYLSLALATGSLLVGYVLTIQTVRIGDLSVSAPFRYTVLLGAVVFGYLFFDEVPDGFTIVGSLIIVVTGVYAVHLERQGRAARPRSTVS